MRKGGPPIELPNMEKMMPVPTKGTHKPWIKQVRILMLADYKAATGFATVSQNIVANLKKHFGKKLALDICAINYFGEAYAEDESTRVYPVAKMKSELSGKDEFGRHVFLTNLVTHDYDGCFIILDIGLVKDMHKLIAEAKKKKKDQGKKVFKSVYYFPIDGPCYPNWFPGIEVFDEVITYTKYGKGEILKIAPHLDKKIKVIPHGINTGDFHPIPDWDRKIFRETYFKEHAGKFIINGGNRNQARKMLPTLLQGYKELKERGDAFNLFPNGHILYLHCHQADPLGWELGVVMQQLGLKEGKDVLFPPVEIQNHGCDVQTLNNIICSSDVYVTACGSEGWGFWPHQAAACKVPVIAPYATSLIEMSGYGKWFWTIKQLREVFPLESLLRYDVEPGQLRVQLECIKVHPKEVWQRVEDAYKHATSLDWQKVMPLWIKIFEDHFF